MAKFLRNNLKSFSQPLLSQVDSSDKPLMQEEQVVYMITPGNYLKYVGSKNQPSSAIVRQSTTGSQRVLAGDGFSLPSRRRGRSS